MSKKLLNTNYAPAERASEEELQKQIQLFQTNDKSSVLLSKIPAVFFIVNKNRQIIYMNEGALEFSGLSEFASVEGQRPGELFGCIHARTTEGGCGTTDACTYCGAVNAVLESQKHCSAMQDAHLILGPEEKAFDLRIWASQITVGEDDFTTITIQDIGDEKRREVLERVFLHDISNRTTVVLGLIELLKITGGKTDFNRSMENLEASAKVLVDEIESHRVLSAVENETLQTILKPFDTIELLHELANFYSLSNLAKGKNIKIDPKAKKVTITSDRTLVHRILSNMLKNALEEINNEQIVTLGCNREENEVVIWVHNQGYMSKEIQHQIFQRSFSTKGKNRGLGTYSMKLLSSTLKARVKFSSSEEKGTRFSLALPRTQ